MEYTIIEGDAEKEKDVMIQEVVRLIKEGWEPQGGICIHHTPSVRFVQAMIRTGI